MAVVKNSKSGRALFFIDDSGVVFSTSWDYINRLRAGSIRNGFIVLSRLPNPVSADRFPKSPVFNVDTGLVDIPDNPRPQDDAFAKKNTSDKVKPVRDVVL